MTQSRKTTILDRRIVLMDFGARKSATMILLNVLQGIFARQNAEVLKLALPGIGSLAGHIGVEEVNWS